MGSPLRLTLPGSNDREADAAWAIVTASFAQVDTALTRFDAASPLSRLNHACGSWVTAPPVLNRALGAAWRAFRVTKGRFDPRIIGALEAAGERAGVDLPPSPPVLARHDRWLDVDARTGRARVRAPIDLGGIGKGLALRWTAARLRKSGHDRFLLSAGGDVVAAGDGPVDRPWVVGIEDPVGGRIPLAVFEVKDAAVATSSIAVRAWRDSAGALRHHLIDPATLAPARPIWTAVTVVDRDPAWAEVRSKVAFLAGQGIAEWVHGRRAWWVDASAELHAAASPQRFAPNIPPTTGRTALGAVSRHALNARWMTRP